MLKQSTGLKKLLRYEFKYYFRIMPPLYLALAVLALAAGIQLRYGDAEYAVTTGGFSVSSNPGWTELLSAIWAFLFIAVCIITATMIVQRFSDNLLKDPGYLMFTLPVTGWALTASKALSAFCMIVISVLVGIASAFILSFGTGQHFIRNTDWQYLWDSVLTWNNFAAAIAILVVVFQQICLIYALMSASHILPRFRAPACIVAYFTIMTLVEQPISRAVTGIASDGFSNEFSYLIPFGIVAIVFAALYFWLTGFLLKNTLNLE